jgi:hypothetical protein
LTALPDGLPFRRKGAQQIRGGAMIKLITWDIWIAAALAVSLAGIFDPVPVVFVAVFLALCAYVVVETIYGKPR